MFLTSLLVVVVAGVAWTVIGIFEMPDIAPIVASRGDWVSAQQKIFDVVRVPRARQAPIALTERELTAIASRHLSESTDLPLSDTIVHVGQRGTIEIAGRLPLRAVVAETALARVVRLLPVAWADYPIWLRFEVRPRVERRARGQRALRLDLDGFALGRRRLPTFLPRLLLSPPALALFSIPLPDSVEAAEVQPGRLVLRTSGS